MHRESISLSLRLLLVLTIFLISSFGKVYSQNGSFGAPTIEDFNRLTPTEHELFQARFSRLNEPNFLSKGHFVTASFHATAEGKKELIEITRVLTDRAAEYSRYVFIGRSPAGILAFMYGISSVMPQPFPKLGDLPYSYRARTERPEDELIGALRAHLSLNGLSPGQIAVADKPILFIDAVSTGMTAHHLFIEIEIWAKEMGIWPKVKKNIHFLGYYPAKAIAEDRLTELARQSAKEMGAAFQRPSDRELQEVVKTMELPNKKDLAERVGKVLEVQISGALFNYASIFCENVQDSFVPAVWNVTFDRLARNSFHNRHESDPHLEIYYLMYLGKQVGGLMRTAVDCANGLTQASTALNGRPPPK